MRLFTRRRFIKVLTALSIFLSVAITALRARSVFVTDVIFTTSGIFDEDGFSRETVTVIENGKISFEARDYKGAPNEPMFWRTGQLKHSSFWRAEWPHRYSILPEGSEFELHDRHAAGHYESPSYRSRRIAFPLWLPLLILASPAIVRGVLAFRARSRARVGHCPRCSYDTRANPAKCSECGHESASESATG